MNKRVEELLQSWGNDKEQVPDFFSKDIDDVLNSLPGSNIKVDEKPKRIKWLGKGLIAASVLTFGVIGSGFVSPAMAQVLKEIPIIGSIFGGSSDTSLQIIEEQGLASQLNETITYNGISLTITEAFIGGGRIAIAYTIESDDIVLQNINNEQGVPLSFDAKLNGQQFDYISEFEQSVNNGIVTGIINMNYGLSYSLIDQPTLFLYVNEIAGVQGSWNFELLLGNEATSEVTEGFAPLVSATWDDATFVVERVEFTPVQSQVIFDSTMPRQEMGLYSFNIFDENGTSLGFGGGSGGAVNELENGMVNFRETVLLPGYEEAPNGIIIEITKNKGGLADPSNYLEVKVPLHETELPHSISYSDGSKLIITGYEQLEDKTIVHYDIEGKLSLQNTFLMLTNSKGEGIIELVEPERTSLEKLSFKREFEKSEGPVTLSTSMEKVNTIQWQLLEVELDNQ